MIDENFARAFAGVGKVRQAIAAWSGETRMVYLTVAASDGTSVKKTSDLYTTLVGAINNLKDPVQIFDVGGYKSLAFDPTVALLVDKVNFTTAKVQSAVKKALKAEFSFANRSFAAVTAEIVALIWRYLACCSPHPLAAISN